jgi:hypothetical protein
MICRDDAERHFFMVIRGWQIPQISRCPLKDQRELIGIHSRDNIVDGLAGKKLMLNGDSVSNGFSRRQ